MASKIDGNQIPSPSRIGVVTGGNKGIGLEICRQLASNGIRVILTARDARDEKRGLKAVEKLKQSGISHVIFHRLDVTDHSSIDSLSEFIKNTFGKLDILVNNAGIIGATMDYEMFRSSIVNGKTGEIPNIKTQETYKWAEECLDTNYYGVKDVTEALIPHLLSSESPRIVNVSSYYGKLQFIPNESVRKEMDNIDSLTEKKIDEILQSFLNDFKEEDLTKNNWPTPYSAYIMSKVAMSAYTRIIAKKYPAICANCVHPGYVKTDINGNTGTAPVEDGAKGPVLLALLHTVVLRGSSMIRPKYRPLCNIIFCRDNIFCELVGNDENNCTS